MTLRHIHIFLAVCENDCNTTKTARALHLSQPAVSLAIRELEEHYGVALFERFGRRLRISEAGKRFLDYALSIDSLVDDLEKNLRSWDKSGVLRVGASLTIGSRFLPAYVRAFRASRPQLEIRAFVAPSDRLEEKLLRGELDLALVEGIIHSQALVSEPYMEDRLEVVCAKDSSLPDLLSIEEFRSQPLLLREQGSGTREVFDRTAAQAGFVADPLWESMSTTALIEAAVSGLGVAVVPFRLAENALREGRLRSLQVEGLAFRRSFHVAYHSEKILTPAIRAFIAHCRSFEEGRTDPE